MKNIVLVYSIILTLLCSCSGSKITSIEREDIFSLEIGPMEDQIAMYDIGGEGTFSKTSFTMRDGLFYIVDGTSGKIVRYNSYGDLLFMVYNEETNPAPMSLKKLDTESSQVTRWAISYPLHEPGEISVDSRKHIFVEDRLPRELHGFDSENRALLDSIILHFDSDGRFVEYLGQQGIGSTPFPRITGIYTSIRDELAVVCRLQTGWNIYWFSSGTLLYLVQIKNGNIPKPPDWPQLYQSIDAVMAAPDVRKLYVKVDYYRDTVDESTNTHTGIEPYGSVVWTLNVEDGEYSQSMKLPFYEPASSESGRQDNIKMLYSMLGSVKNGKIFLYYPDEDGYSIMILNANSQERRRGFIKVDSNALQYNVFDISAEGLISAMMADDFKVTMAWWRTDKFIGETQ